MIRLVLEIVVAVILAITATLSFVSFKQGKDVQKQVVEAKKKLAKWLSALMSLKLPRTKLTLLLKNLMKQSTKDHIGPTKAKWDRTNGAA